MANRDVSNHNIPKSTSRKRQKHPVAFIFVDGNSDHEEDTSIRKYVNVMNSLRSAHKATPLSLYSSLSGPRIKDRFHIYEPITEIIYFCDLNDAAERFDQAEPHEQSVLLVKLQQKVKSDLNAAVKKAPATPSFEDDVSPKIIYVNPKNLRRVQPPVRDADVDSSLSSHCVTDSHQCISIPTIAQRLASQHPHLPNLASQLLDPSNTWSVANLKSAILLIRFAKVLNRIRQNKLGLPPYTLYWTAATRNKELSNPRLGLILWDPMTEQLAYTGSPYDCLCETEGYEHRELAVLNSMTEESSPFVQKMMEWIRSSHEGRQDIEEQLAAEFVPLAQAVKMRKALQYGQGHMTLHVAYSNDPSVDASNWIVAAEDERFHEGKKCSLFKWTKRLA